MLSPASWHPQAEGMQTGDRRRVNHDCGGGRTLTLRCDDSGLHAHCFRCNDSGWLPPEPVPLAIRLERIRKAQEADNRVACTTALPEPQVRVWAEWPAACRLWLLKAGLCSADLPRLGAYYHPPSDRVVLPVLSPSGGVLFWQARAVDKRQPKYLAPPIDKATVIAAYGCADTVTLTEDLLSAYKVGKVGEGWSLLGTKINHYMLAKLAMRKCKVNVWLDPDPPGRAAAKKVLAALRSVGVEARDILTDRDPKLLHLEQIKELV